MGVSADPRKTFRENPTVAAESPSASTADADRGVPSESAAAMQLARTLDEAGHAFNNLLARMICLAEEIQDATDLRMVHDRAELLIITAEGGARLVRQLIAPGDCPPLRTQATPQALRSRLDR